MLQLEIKNIAVNYGKKEVIKDVSCVFNGGDVISLIGPNGTGKTAIIEVLNIAREYFLGSLKKENREKLEKEIVQTEPGVGIIQEGINTTSKKDSKVNINTANKEKLATLPGIGEGTAEKIIEYRSKTGKFKTIDEIKKIPGIGESKFKSLKDKITIK